MINESQKLAVLIDADNASAEIIEPLLEEIAKYGIASVKRIYGDWSSGLKKWKSVLLPYAITPVQQFAYTKGKNATDMALVIDAMDLLYSNTFDGFCLVSSDSDFTRLASRLRENGLVVYGFGERKTPEAFRKACDKFIYTEIFQSPTKNTLTKNKKTDLAIRSQNKTSSTVSDESLGEYLIDHNLLHLLFKAVKENADDLGWARLAGVGSYVSKVLPDFDARNYGFSKLSNLVKSLHYFETETHNNQLSLRIVTEAVESLPDNSSLLSQIKQGNHSTQRKKQNSSQEIQVTQAEEGLAISTDISVTHHSSHQAPVNKKKQGRPPKENAMATSQTLNLPSGYSFARLIPLVQHAIMNTADKDGWARLGNVVKQLTVIDPSFIPQPYGFEDVRSAILSIYDDWIETQKIGRGERVRIRKKFIVREDKTNYMRLTEEEN